MSILSVLIMIREKMKNNDPGKSVEEIQVGLLMIFFQRFMKKSLFKYRLNKFDFI